MATGTDVIELSLVDNQILRIDLTLGTSFSQGLDVGIPGIEFLENTFEELGIDDLLDLSGSAGLLVDNTWLKDNKRS